MADRHHATTLSSHTHWDKSRRLVLHSYAELKKVFLPREFQLKTNRELNLEVRSQEKTLTSCSHCLGL